MLEPDEPKADEMEDEPWDGPSPAPPEEASKDSQKDSDYIIGANELRVVRKIEESLKNPRGPRIQVIKSRELKNAEHFSEKVIRALKAHNYPVKELTVETLKETPSEEDTPVQQIYSIREATIKEFLGPNLNQAEKPMQYLFDNSMLAYLQNPILLSIVSDSFYGKVGLQNYVNSMNQPVLKQEGVKETGTVRDVNRLTTYSFYLAAASFLLSGLENIAGSYMQFGSGNIVYTPLPFTILVLSLIAISVRAFSLGKDDGRSRMLASTAIILFIAILLLGIVTSYFGLPYSGTFGGIYPDLLTLGQNIVLTFVSFAVMILAFTRYPLFLGANSGRGAYALSVAGILLGMAVILSSSLPQLNVYGQTLSTGFTILPNLSPLALLQSIPTPTYYFVPEIPQFGMANYFSVSGTSQYLILKNYILLVANLILSLSFFLAIKSQNSRSLSQ